MNDEARQQASQHQPHGETRAEAALQTQTHSAGVPAGREPESEPEMARAARTDSADGARLAAADLSAAMVWTTARACVSWFRQHTFGI